jgi:2-polyprenyl-3-methyl-5-hydroxy-6-metoxy-1,4-benzoquinol methylase
LDTAALQAGLTGVRTRCPACLTDPARPAFSTSGFRFRRCPRCHTLFLEQPPDPEAAEELYSGERYYANPEYERRDYCGYKDYLADRQEIEKKFGMVLSHVERYMAPGRLLDVGAGPGFLLHVARERGWRAQGLDLNPWSVNYAREEVGVAVERGTLQEAELPQASFDAVTMLDLLEHVADPEQKIAEAARITRSGGALAVLTPDAGSLTTRLFGRRWPEAQRVPEHVVLFSVLGLSELLARNGWEPLGWHTVGKTSSVETLLADLKPVAPAVGDVLLKLLEGRRMSRYQVELDPRAKFCLYARRRRESAAAEQQQPSRRPIRLPKRAVDVEEAVLDSLEALADARRLCDWMYEQYAPYVHGSVAEVGAGIGTFSERMLAGGAERLLLLEPDPACIGVLERRLGTNASVRVAAEGLPGSPALAEAGLDLVVCQNVLEHIEDDQGSIDAMAAALAPGGRMTLLVPAHPRLYGPLDDAYGHYRRYTRRRLRLLFERAGLEVTDLYSFNLLGVAGWWVTNRRPGAVVNPRSLAVYEALVRFWRPIERRLRPPWGLSLIVHARRPEGPAATGD